MSGGRRRSDRAAWLGLAAAALGAAGCAPVPQGPDPLPPGLAGTSWRAESVTGLPVLPGVASTLAFSEDGGRVAGDAGCNRYGGPLAVEDGELRVGPLVATRVACAPPPTEQERRFLTALEQGRRFELVDGRRVLLLRSAGREAPTRFVRLGGGAPG